MFELMVKIGRTGKCWKTGPGGPSRPDKKDAIFRENRPRREHWGFETKNSGGSASWKFGTELGIRVHSPQTIGCFEQNSLNTQVLQFP